jgi:hypothetical protein
VQSVFSNTLKYIGENTHVGKMGNRHKVFVAILLGKEQFWSLTGGEIYIEMLTQRNEIEDCGLD